MEWNEIQGGVENNLFMKKKGGKWKKKRERAAMGIFQAVAALIEPINNTRET